MQADRTDRTANRRPPPLVVVWQHLCARLMHRGTRGVWLGHDGLANKKKGHGEGAMNGKNDVNEGKS